MEQHFVETGNGEQLTVRQHELLEDGRPSSLVECARLSMKRNVQSLADVAIKPQHYLQYMEKQNDLAAAEDDLKDELTEA